MLDLHPYEYCPKVTAIHSVNAMLANDDGEKSGGNYCLYNPKLSELPFDLAKKVSKCTDSVTGEEYRFAAVYDGYYDAEVMTDNVKANKYLVSKNLSLLGINNRQLQTLGQDIVVLDEEVIPEYSGEELIWRQGVQIATQAGTDDNMSKATAIMATYKALEQYCYEVKIGFLRDQNMSLANSPVGEQISAALLATELNTEAGAAQVWVGRSNVKNYLAKAVDDGIIQIPQGKLEGVAQAASGRLASYDFLSKYCDEKGAGKITLAQFCKLVYKMADIYGEPVVSTAERNLLLQLYGCQMPIYLEAEELEAVKYLAAKGILEPSELNDLEWSEPLRLSQMLDILMRLKDVGSRYTFKELTPTIDPELANKGYFEAEISAQSSPVMDIKLSYQDAAYYDYVIPIIPNVTVPMKDRTLQLNGIKYYVMARDGSGKKVEVSNLDITEDGQFTFKIQKDLVDNVDATYSKKGTYVIKCAGTKLKFKISDKGGTYSYNADDFKKKKRKLNRKKHANADRVDAERSPRNKNTSNETKKQSVTNEKGLEFEDDNNDGVPDDAELILWSMEQFRAMYYRPTASGSGITTTGTSSTSTGGNTQAAENAKTVLFTAKITDVQNDNIKVYGQSIKGALTDRNGISISSGGSFTIKAVGRIFERSELMQFQATGFKSLTEFTENLTLEPDTQYGVVKYKAFISEKGQYLVNYDWLRDLGIVRSKRELEGDVRLIVTRFNNIYLCPNQHLAIIGNVVRQLDDDELAYYEKDGKLYVNLNILVGWAGAVQALSQNESEITLSIPAFYQPSGSMSAVSIKDVYYQAGAQKFVFEKSTVHYPTVGTKDLTASAVDKITTMYTMRKTTGSRSAEQYTNATYINFYFGYGLSNHFVYLTKSNRARLYVFKLPNPKATKAIKDEVEDANDKARKSLESDLGVTAPDDWIVEKYTFQNEGTTATGLFKKKLYNAGIPTLLYKLPVVKGRKFVNAYYGHTGNSAVSSTALIVPFMQPESPSTSTLGSELYDVNFNIFEIDNVELPWSTVPSNIIPCLSIQPVATSPAGPVRWKPSLRGILTSGDVGFVSSGGVATSMNIAIAKEAPTGVLNRMMNLWHTTKDNVKKYVTASNTYVGTTCLWYSRKKHKFMLTRKNKLDELDLDGDYADMSILYCNNYGYVLSPKVDERLESTDGKLDVDKFKGKKAEGTPVIQVDWEQFTFTNLIHSIDNGLTVVLLVCLVFIPRLMMFDCLLLIALAVIKDSPIVKRFAEKVIDPFKLLTFGGRDINTVNEWRLLWDSIIGLSIFGLFLDGAIIQLIGWVARAVAAIVSM